MHVLYTGLGAIIRRYVLCSQLGAFGAGDVRPVFALLRLLVVSIRILLSRRTRITHTYTHTHIVHGSISRYYY